jgi:hypothetical protein
MRRAQADRAVIAARAAASGRVSTPNTGASPSISLLARTQTHVIEYGYVGVRRHGNKVKASGGMRRGDGTGRQSEWARSPYFWTDAKWSRTVSS